MFVEGQVSLPRQEGEVARFESEICAAKEAGAKVVRTALLSGRRYETFKSAESFRRFAETSWRALALAEPVLAKHGIRLAIENHKDWLVPELLDLVQRISSQHIGICVDTGNNLALLENPMAVVEVLAPFAFSSHLKDMAVQEYDEGFLLSEVPLGEGFLDLPRITALLQKVNSTIQFSLEMITRDPLKIPCLSEKYWATMENLPARHLAATLTMVRRHAARNPLPRIRGLDTKQQLVMEDENVRKSFAYARRHLGL
jgi:sugar phosphate isomerase/epimerase